MAKSEEELRLAKDGMISAIAEQQKRVGMVDVAGRAAENFVAPILEKMDRLEETPAPQESEVILADIGGDAAELETEKVSRELVIMHGIFRRLLRHQDWSPRINKAMKLCGRHAIGGRFHDCRDCARREEQLARILQDAFKAYGNPLIKKGPGSN